MSVSCRVCGRVLKDPVSIERGIGPTCIKGIRRNVDGAQRADPDMPFDPVRRDIVFRRDEHNEVHFNISQRHVDHSPSGFEWGYGGSGPSDFALNILALFEDCFPKVKIDERTRLWDGTTVHPEVYRLHQRFKTDFLIYHSRDGGAILGHVIRDWITDRIIERERAEAQ